MDDTETKREKQALRRQQEFKPQIPIELRWSEWAHKPAGDALKPDMTMLRIGSMNLMLHGVQHPQFFYRDTLSKAFNDEKSLDVC